MSEMLVVTAFAVLMSSTNAEAALQRFRSSHTIYYSDVGLTNAVGTVTLYCDGSVDGTSEITGYSSYEAFECP